MAYEEMLFEILERVRHRYYGKYRGTVTDIDDATLRIKAKVPSVLADQTTGWCMPCVPYAGPDVGFAFLPEVGAGVWIEFEGGDVSYPIWTGCYWRSDEIPSDAKPAVKTIVTKAGHKILLDDDASTINITDPNDNKIVIESSSIKVEQGGNNKATLESSGIKLERGANKVAISDSNVSVNDGAFEVM